MTTSVDDHDWELVDISNEKISSSVQVQPIKPIDTDSIVDIFINLDLTFIYEDSIKSIRRCHLCKQVSVNNKPVEESCIIRQTRIVMET